MIIQELVALAQRIHDTERMNFGSSSTRDERNANWERIVGIARHGHPTYNPTPDPQWYIKRASLSRPPSDDVAVRMPDRHFWDCIPSSGADGYRFEASGDHGPLPDDQIAYAPRVPAGHTGINTPPNPIPLPPTNRVWSAAHQRVMEKLEAKLTVTTEVAARQLSHSIMPREVWGQKRAAQGRSISQDTIALQTGAGLFGVQILPAVKEWGILDAAQVFEPVTPYDYLGEVGEPEQPPSPVPTPLPPSPPVPVPSSLVPIDGNIWLVLSRLDAINAALLQQAAGLDELHKTIEALEAKIGSGAVTFPTYTGRIFGATLTLTPNK